VNPATPTDDMIVGAEVDVVAVAVGDNGVDDVGSGVNVALPFEQATSEAASRNVETMRR